MSILTEVTQLVDGVDTVTAKDIMDTQETAINAKKTVDNFSLEIGTVTSTDAEASAEIVGTSPNYKINLNLPKGEKGEQGESGSQGNVSELVNLIYPVGSIYMSVNSVNPSTLFAGTTWEQWGGGRVPVGIGNNGETNYTTAEQTGGSENSVASHNHTQNSHNHSQNAHRHNVYGESNWNSDATGLQYKDYCRSIAGIKDEGSSGYFATWPKSGAYILQTTTATNNATTATNNATGTTGGNRQPFITCYMWKRTA